MYRFPRVQLLRGELKRSEIRGNVRYQLTTKEFVQQRGHNTYRIALEHIIGLVECTDADVRHLAPFAASEDKFGKPYKIVTSLMHMVSPSGVSEQTKVSFYTRLSQAFVRQMEYLLQGAANSAS